MSKAKENILKGVGLSERETQVYLAVMTGGKVSQTDISQSTGINRTSLYPIMRELLKRDFIIRTVEGKRQFYLAESPEKILKKADVAHAALAQAVPGLMDLYATSGHKPKITVHNGPEGLYKAVRTALGEAHDHVKSFSSPKTFVEVLSRKDADELIALIEKREVTSYSLSSHTEANKKLLPTFSQKRVQWKLMPKGIEFPIEFLLYNKTTVITSWGRQFSVVIESEDITNFLESLFDYFWKVSSK